jgi:hypothetical protein
MIKLTARPPRAPAPSTFLLSRIGNAAAHLRLLAEVMSRCFQVLLQAGGLERVSGSRPTASEEGERGVRRPTPFVRARRRGTVGLSSVWVTISQEPNRHVVTKWIKNQAVGLALYDARLDPRPPHRLEDDSS